MNQDLVPLYNPTKSDFEISYDINEDRKPIMYILHALEIEYFPRVVADHIKNHLAKKIIYDQGKERQYDLLYPKIVKEIEVSLDE